MTAHPDFPARLSEGYRAFLGDRFISEQTRYEELAAAGQKPEIMIVGCCDSRVSPEVIFDARPGEMFVVRNVANLVPPYAPDGRHHSASAALEFAVQALRVKHIVVLGHGRCGGVQAFADQDSAPLSPGESGAGSLTKAPMSPQCACPSTTMCFTLSACTANSSAALVPW